MNDIINQDSARANPENAAFFKAMDSLSDALNLMKAIEPDAQLEAWQNMAGDQTTPVMVAQVLMNALPFEGEFPRASKVFWLEVAEYMGPDWIGTLRRVAAFMDKVDQF